MEVPNLKSLPSLIKILNNFFFQAHFYNSRIILSHKFNLSAGSSKYSVLTLKKSHFSRRCYTVQSSQQLVSQGRCDTSC